MAEAWVAVVHMPVLRTAEVLVHMLVLHTPVLVLVLHMLVLRMALALVHMLVLHTPVLVLVHMLVLRTPALAVVHMLVLRMALARAVPLAWALVHMREFHIALRLARQPQ